MDKVKGLQIAGGAGDGAELGEPERALVLAQQPEFSQELSKVQDGAGVDLTVGLADPALHHRHHSGGGLDVRRFQVAGGGERDPVVRSAVHKPRERPQRATELIFAQL